MEGRCQYPINGGWIEGIRCARLAISRDTKNSRSGSRENRSASGSSPHGKPRLVPQVDRRTRHDPRFQRRWRSIFLKHQVMSGACEDLLSSPDELQQQNCHWLSYVQQGPREVWLRARSRCGGFVHHAPLNTTPDHSIESHERALHRQEI